MTFQTMVTLLAQSFGTTLSIFTLTLLGALPLGLLVTFGRRSKFAPLRAVVKFYISVMRGTPLMLQLIVVFFCPNLLFGITMPSNWRFTAAIVAFIINYAAYFAEIYRGGIESIPVGQYEAAEVLGYSKNQTFFNIIGNIETGCKNTNGDCQHCNTNRNYRSGMGASFCFFCAFSGRRDIAVRPFQFLFLSLCTASLGGLFCHERHSLLFLWYISIIAHSKINASYGFAAFS